MTWRCGVDDKTFDEICQRAREANSLIEVLDEIYAAGGYAWDEIEDVKAALDEIRGEDDA